MVVLYADACSAPQVCNAVGSGQGTCTTPIPAGNPCTANCKPHLPSVSLHLFLHYSDHLVVVENLGTLLPLLCSHQTFQRRAVVIAIMVNASDNVCKFPHVLSLKGWTLIDH